MTDKEFFEAAITVVLKHEGGYVNNPSDPGGETNFGICKRSYPHVNVKALTTEQAKAIYKRDFWDPHPYKEIQHKELAVKIFDFSINMGQGGAFRLLHKAMKVVGIKTEECTKFNKDVVKQVNSVPGPKLLQSLKDEAAARYRKLVAKNPKLSKFLKGWLKRAYE